MAAAGSQPQSSSNDYGAVARSPYFVTLLLLAAAAAALVGGWLRWQLGPAFATYPSLEIVPWAGGAAVALLGVALAVWAAARSAAVGGAGGGGGGAVGARVVEAAERLARGDLTRIDVAAAGVGGADEAALHALEKARARFAELTRRAGAVVAEQLALSERVRTTINSSLDRVNDIVAAVSETGGAAGEMSASLKQISEHMEQLASSAEESSSSILEMAATNDEVAENIQNLAASVGETATSIEQMAYSIKEVAKNIEALSSMTEETSSSMSEMDISISQVEANATETARLSEQVRRDAFEGVQALGKTIEGINRIKSSSSEAAGVIFALEDKIKAIGKILSVIDDVAEQTNLLALNAAIIAAQAGEHGKGFSVVADEIKDLADRAGASTKEIASLIESVTVESQRAVKAMEIGVRSVEEGVRLAESTEGALKQILGSSTKATDMVNAIARTTVEQSRGSKQVTDSITRIAETFTQIATATAEQARGTELIMRSAEQMKVITQHVERSSQEQARGSKQITMSIENISKMVNQVNVAQRDQSRGSDKILLQVERVKGIAEQQQEGLRELVNVVGDLSVRSESLEKELASVTTRT
jgi:methyl-accepting chemotaxis protein